MESDAERGHPFSVTNASRGSEVGRYPANAACLLIRGRRDSFPVMLAACLFVFSLSLCPCMSLAPFTALTDTLLEVCGYRNVK